MSGMGGNEMRRNMGVVWVLVMLATMAWAAPWAKTYSLATATVAVTNDQVNSVWCPVAVLWSFTEATTGTVTASRTSQGNTYLLGRLVVSNASTVIWVAEADYPFEQGDVLVLTSTVTNGAAQVILK
jgi:hypothetical protein